MAAKGLRVAWCGDAGCTTGFGRVTHAVCDRLITTHGMDLRVLAVNWRGTPEVASGALDATRMWQANWEDRGDIYGLKRLPRFLAATRPDVVVVYNDLPVAAPLIDALRHHAPHLPIVLYYPIDGAPVPTTWLGPLYAADARLTFTQWANDVVAQADPLLSPAGVIPHGVDPAVYHPISRTRPGAVQLGPDHDVLVTSRDEARALLGLGDRFVVLWSDRNSVRKSPQTAFAAVAPLVAEHPEVVLYVHCKLADEGGDIALWVDRYGMSRYTRTTPGLDSWVGVPEYQLNALYNAADVRISTAHGEGFGLHGVEAAAAGLAQVVPDAACFPEVIGPGALYVPPESSYTTARGVDFALPRVGAYTDALRQLYRDPGARAGLGAAGRAHVLARYNWDAIAAQFATAITDAAAAGVQSVLVG